MVNHENKRETSDPELAEGWVIHLPGRDGQPGAGGSITQAMHEEMLADPAVQVRLDRVHRLRESLGNGQLVSEHLLRHS